MIADIADIQRHDYGDDDWQILLFFHCNSWTKMHLKGCILAERKAEKFLRYLK